MTDSGTREGIAEILRVDVAESYENLAHLQGAIGQIFSKSPNEA